MGGRKPDPPALRLLKNDVAHRHRYANKSEPVPSESKAVAPESLSERGKQLFNEFVARVEEMYPCSETDAYSIALYANNHEQLEYLERYLRTSGLSYVTDTGQVRAQPEVLIHNQCKMFELKILVEFGLTPSARARVNVPKKPDVKRNAFADLDETG